VKPERSAGGRCAYLVVLPILARRRRSLEGAGKNLGCSFKLDGCGPESPHLFDLFLTRAANLAGATARPHGASTAAESAATPRFMRTAELLRPKLPTSRRAGG
jgi:hypothetical protein